MVLLPAAHEDPFDRVTTRLLPAFDPDHAGGLRLGRSKGLCRERTNTAGCGGRGENRSGCQMLCGGAPDHELADDVAQLRLNQRSGGQATRHGLLPSRDPRRQALFAHDQAFECAAENSLQNLRVRRGPSLGRHNNCWARPIPERNWRKIRPESPALLSRRRGAECFVKMLNSQRPQAGNRPCLA